MASVQEPEVQFAQRLASNEKPVRTRAMKKLRKYIFVRSQKATGGFTGEELLKLWKGLFYCLWMQDKLLLQEELNAQISSLLHSFQDVDGQFLYLDSFLQTFKREWMGIDRLRMDKFFQLVRFMFRQTFEMLKRTNWDSSVVSRFLELLTVQLLQSKSAAPSGLQFHILDLYMSELAAVASQQLTADQNLKFIEPFCRTAAKTKDRTLFRAICSSIFSTIIDQAPFAIEDLMKELEADEVSDSGQASGEEEEEQEDDDGRGRKMLNEDVRKKRINGHRSNDDYDDAEPVLQFDYGALAARLLELASGSGTPSHNRQRLYKIVKVLRDLSEGIFPQDEYPEEVSTDEDDDMFGSRKRMKRRGHMGEDDAPDSKKTKRKKKEPAALNKEIKESANDEKEPAVSKKKRKKKKKKKALPGGATTEASEEKQTETSQKEAQNADSAEKTLEEEEGPSEPSVTGENDKKEKMSEEKVGELQERADVSSNTEVVVSEKKKNKKSLNTAKNMEVNAMSVEEDSSPATNVKHEKVGMDAQEEENHAGMTSVSEETAANRKFKKKKNSKQEELTSPAAHQCVETPPKKNQDDGGEEETPLEAEMENTTRMTPVKKKKKKKKKLPGNKNDADGEKEEVPEGQIEGLSSSETPAKKKKRKIPVVFEFEADELEATASVNGITGGETTAKKTEVIGDVREPSSPPSAQRSQKKKKKKATSSDFITFQSNTTVPTPLFFRTKRSLSTPLSSRKKTQTPKSESKKVTFGLKNNKTAEFKKTDRSLLVSPDGSSRIPFDPKQKPKFGVLKSPATPRSAKLQKMATSNRKRFSSPQVTPKGRPTAADFF